MLTLYEMSLLYYHMATYSVVKRNLASVIKSWNNCSECFVGIKVTGNCFDFIGE